MLLQEQLLMQKKKFNLGGEQSGHIILGKFATTGDGLLVALEVIQALNKKIKASHFFDVFDVGSVWSLQFHVVSSKRSLSSKNIVIQVRESEILTYVFCST